MREKFPYEDIIDLPPHISTKHPQPTLLERAARFSPFAAVTGYEEMVLEEARYTEEKVELDESAKEKLSEKLETILHMMEASPVVSILYFEPDLSKSGGKYVEISGIIKQVDSYRRLILLQNGQRIPIEDIYDIKGDIFEKNPLL